MPRRHEARLDRSARDHIRRLEPELARMPAFALEAAARDLRERADEELATSGLLWNEVIVMTAASKRPGSSPRRSARSVAPRRTCCVG